MKKKVQTKFIQKNFFRIFQNRVIKKTSQTGLEKKNTVHKCDLKSNIEYDDLCEGGSKVLINKILLNIIVCFSAIFCLCKTIFSSKKNVLKLQFDHLKSLD